MAAHGARRLLPMAENADAVVGIELLAAAQGCDFHAPLHLQPAAGGARARCCAARVPHARRRPLLPPRHRRPPSTSCAAARSPRRSRAVALPGLRRRRAHERRTGSTVERGRRAAGRQLPAHRHRASRRTSTARLVSPWLARKDADWWVDQLYDFARELGATTVRTAISRTVIDVNRDPSGASLYPGQATTEPVPDHDVRRRAALRAGAEPDDGGDRERRARRTSSPTTPRSRPSWSACAARHAERGALRLPTRSARSIPRLFDGELPDFNIGTNSGRELRPGADAPRSRPPCDGRGFSHVTNGRFKGGWITRHYGAPERRRPRDADGARLPRLHATSRRARCAEATGRPRTTPAMRRRRPTARRPATAVPAARCPAPPSPPCIGRPRPRTAHDPPRQRPARIRAAPGTELSARSWLTEAPLRMLMNNLDPDVAERPGELVVYGGIGRAARDWESFDRIVATLRTAGGRRDPAGPVGQAGRRVPHPRRTRRAC